MQKIRNGSRNMKYKKISQDIRSTIITELTQNGRTLKEVSDLTSLKPSTVKAILQVYMKEGRIGKKATRDRKVKILNTTVIALVDKSKNDARSIQNLDFLHSFVKVNQHSSEISHSGQTLTDTQEKLEIYSKQVVSTEVREFLREKKYEILDKLTTIQAKQNFMNQLQQFELCEELPLSELNEVKLSNADEERICDKISEKLKKQIKLR